MKEIENREDVRHLVDAFYAKIQVDKELGPIFNMHLSPTQWPPHLVKLTDFWETNLFGIPKFKGNPARAHAVVDRNISYSVTQEHFNHWLELWIETVDAMYVGVRAENAKNAARRMARGLFLAVWHSRPENTLDPIMMHEID